MENPSNSVLSTKKLNKVSYCFDDVGQISRQASTDIVVVEQPLQVRLAWDEQGLVKNKVFSITMRTPNDDAQLILGLLFSEGVIRAIADIENISQEHSEEGTSEYENQWLAQLATGVKPRFASLERYQMTYSSCGLCGTTSLKALEMNTPATLATTEQQVSLSARLICTLAASMKAEQGLFAETGGTHGAALFTARGKLLEVYEDIGRHNAVDKVIGAHLQTKGDRGSAQSDLQPLILVVSSRISFEIVQKTIMAGFCILVAVGAPSDLSIKAAKRFGLTLIGFSSDNSFNVYHGDWRIQK